MSDDSDWNPGSYWRRYSNGKCKRNGVRIGSIALTCILIGIGILNGVGTLIVFVNGVLIGIITPTVIFKKETDHQFAKNYVFLFLIDPSCRIAIRFFTTGEHIENGTSCCQMASGFCSQKMYARSPFLLEFLFLGCLEDRFSVYATGGLKG
uniref:Uncharacterized protein n=1 Tax=Glossina brevipalpis TaxID=37001 RepID=A0A1A9W7I9_9MUSC